MRLEHEIRFMRAIPGLALLAFLGLFCFRYRQWCDEFGVWGTVLTSIAICAICLFAALGPVRLILARSVQNMEIAAAWAILSAFKFLLHQGYVEAYLFASVAIAMAGIAAVQWTREQKEAAAGNRIGIDSRPMPRQSPD